MPDRSPIRQDELHPLLLATNRGEDMEAFEPPKYLISLTAAINEGAKAAQASALLFLLIGLYLLATAFSASDEDLLLGRAVTISQIGAALPVSFSFAIAPLVFVFQPIYTLVRYDLLAANVRQFREELCNTVPLESDRERCRQLLANVEFIVMLTTPRRSALYSRLWTWLFRGIVAVFPVSVLLLAQINALRYQSDLIVSTQRMWLMLDLLALIWFFRRNASDRSAWPEQQAAKLRRWTRLVWVPAFVGGLTQRIWLMLDLLALVWFFRRDASDRSAWPEQQAAKLRRWTRLMWVPLIVGGVDWLYLNTVPVETDWRLVRYDPNYDDNPKGWWAYAVGNPLDLIFCPRLNWGCRFLRVDHRTEVDKVRDEKAMSVLRMDVSALAQDVMTSGGNSEQKAAERTKAIAAIEGVFLRDRSLRFAVLDESRLYAADLINADLRKASLTGTDISGARLRGTLLRGSNLTGSQLAAASRDLEKADFSSLDLSSREQFNFNFAGDGANLSGANLSKANLSDTALGRVNLSGANLSEANLSNAHLVLARLNRADLSEANLSEADLSDASLQDTNLRNAVLRHVNLTRALLDGAILNGVNLSGANLDGAFLNGTFLNGVNLYGAKIQQSQLDLGCGSGASLPAGLNLRPCSGK